MNELIKKSLEKIDLIKTSVAIVSLLLMSFVCYALVKVPIPDGNKEALYIIIGIISGTVSTIANFYFGSSKGSQKKDDIIKIQTDQITK